MTPAKGQAPSSISLTPGFYYTLLAVKPQRLIRAVPRLSMSLVQCQEKDHQRRYDLRDEKDTRIIGGMIISKNHLPNVPQSISE